MNARLLLVFLALVLAACGSAPLAEPPVYPDATPAARGESPLADAMMSGFTTEIVGERDAAAIRLFRAPGSIAWDQVKQFYAGRLEPNGWRADARLLVEGDTISYAGWRNGDQLLAIAHTEDAAAWRNLSGGCRCAAIMLSGAGARVWYHMLHAECQCTDFLVVVAALIPLLLIAAWLWRRFYQDDHTDTARTVAKNSLLPIAANLINKVVDFGFAVIALRFLGPEGNGAYAFVALIAGLYFLTITNWGLNDLAVREAAPDLARAPRLFSITLLLRLGIATLLMPVAAILVIGYSLIERPLSSAEMLALALLMIHLYPAALAAACSASFQAYQRMEVTALVLLLTNVVKTLVGVGALIIAPDIPTRVVALAAVALGATMLNAAVFFALQRRMLFRASLVWDWPTGRELLREGFPLLLNSLLLAVFFRFDVVLLRAQAGAEALGLYDAAYKVINMTQIIPPYFVAALFPLLARYAVMDRAALERMYHRALSFLQLLAWPGAVGGTLLAPTIIAIIGGQAFLPGAALALAILIWYLPLSYANGVTQYVLIALRRQQSITVAFAIGALFNLGMNLALIPVYGYLAAATVTVATEAVLLLPFLRTLRREGVAPPLLRLAWRPVVGSCVMGASMWVTLPFSPGAAIVVGMPVYFAALWALGAFGPEEWALVRRMLGRSVTSSG